MNRREQDRFRRYGAMILGLVALTVGHGVAGAEDNRAAGRDLQPPNLNPGERMAVAAKVHPAKFTPADTPIVFLKARIAPGHHIYALTKSLNSSVPTRVEMKLPEGLKLAGEWEAIRPEKSGGALIHRKEAIFRNRLVLAGRIAPGKHKSEVKLSFQVCNEALCWPPESRITEVEFELVDARVK